MPSNLATSDQREIEARALALLRRPGIRVVREAARAILLDDPAARTHDGALGLDRALDLWMTALVIRRLNRELWHPRVIWNIDNTPRRWFGHTFPGGAVAGTNPDNINREMLLDGAGSYILSGAYTNNPTQLTVVVEEEDPNHGLGRYVGALTTQTIKADSQGRFEISVDAHPANGRDNHIQISAGKYSMFTRDSLSDWAQTPTAFSIRRVDQGDAPPLSDDDVVGQVEAMATAFVGYWNNYKNGFLGYPEPNQIVGPSGRAGGWGFLAGGRFSLAEDEALVVTTRDGGSNYTGFQLCDPWTIIPDPVYRSSSLNKAQIKTNPDGSVTYVVSCQDPGVHNWVDTVGLSTGWFLLRWQGVPLTADPAALISSTARVRLSDLPSVLPAGIPMAGLAERRAAIALRVSQFRARTAE